MKIINPFNILFVSFLISSTNAYLALKFNDELIKNRCFNRSQITGEELILGQKEPVGISIENLISLIERFEQKNPSYSPIKVLQTLLQRFHLDGLRYDGKENIPSTIISHQSKLNRLIISMDDININSFPEHQFTEDEKCNLFFTISHIINDTATVYERNEDIYYPNPPQVRLESPFKFVDNNRDLQGEIPIETTTNISSIKQSKNVSDNATVFLDKKHRTKRWAIPKTKRPKEYGVASFLSAKTNPISVNRVLLGMLVGFQNLQPVKMSQIVDKLKGIQSNQNYFEEYIDPLVAITLADLCGIIEPSMPLEEDSYGADGEWEENLCHTKFVLSSNKGTWATLAEFRGGIDGYNIGRTLQDLGQAFPNITVSQVLRFYYSQQGLMANSGICQRGNYLKDLFDVLEEQARRYSNIYNHCFNDGLYSQNRIHGIIKDQFNQVKLIIEKASTLNEEEKSLCRQIVSENIKEQPCETNANVFLMLDISQSCSNSKNYNPNGELCKKQASLIRQLTRKLNLKRNYGSINVFYNSEAFRNPLLVDDQMRLIETPLYSVAYNTTSSECATCKAIYGDTTTKKTIRDKELIIEKIFNYLTQFYENYENRSSMPSTVFYWFDYGTVKDAPSDKIKNVKYENYKRKLLFQFSDVGLRALTTNIARLNDTILTKNNLFRIDPRNHIELGDWAPNSVCQQPSLFNYPDCKRQPSKDFINRDFISPYYKQYWAMFPKHFHSSSKIEMKFRAQDSLIKVCFARTPFPENSAENCKVNNDTNQDLVLLVNNPCKGYNSLSKCPPMYFTISLHQPKPHNQCLQPECKNIKQHEWYFTHTGISCNKAHSIGAISLVSIISITFISSILTHIGF